MPPPVLRLLAWMLAAPALACVPAAASGLVEVKSDPPTENTLGIEAPPFQTIALKDIHPLRGGKLLELHGDGSLYVQVVSWNRDKKELYVKRHKKTLAGAELARVWTTFEKHAFFTLHIAERSGIPGESRPAISVSRAAEATHTVSKWGNQKHADFDAIYLALLNLIGDAQKSAPFFEGPYDSRWEPPKRDAATR